MSQQGPAERTADGWAGRARARLRAAITRAVAAAALIVAVALVSLQRPVARGALLVAIFSVVLAYAVAPLVERLAAPGRRPRLSRAGAVLVLYGCLLAAGLSAWGIAAGAFRRELTVFRSEVTVYRAQLEQRLTALERVLYRVRPPEALADHTRRAVVALTRSARVHAAEVGREIVESRPLVPWLGLVPIVAMLLVCRWSWFRDSTVAALPAGHLRWRGDEFFRHVNRVLAGYTRAVLMSSAIVALVSIAAYAVLGLPYALLLGVVAGLLEFLPVAGPLTAGLMALAVVDGDRLVPLFAFLVGLRLVQDYAIYPRLTGRGMHLRPLAVIVAIFIGAEAGGMLGVLAAIPLVGIGAVGLRHVREYWAIESLLRQHGRAQAALASASGTPTVPAEAGRQSPDEADEDVPSPEPTLGDRGPAQGA